MPQTFFLISDPDNLDYPIYTVYDKSRILDCFCDISLFKTTTITEIELDNEHPDFKISKSSDNIFITNHVIKNTKYSLLDVNTIQMLLDYKDPDYKFKSTHYLYVFYMTQNRFDICDYLIASNIKFVGTYTKSCLLNQNTLTNYHLFKYIINNSEFFGCCHYDLMYAAFRYTKFYDLCDHLIKSEYNCNIDYDNFLRQLFNKTDSNGFTINCELDTFQIKKLIDENYFDNEKLFYTVLYDSFELTKYIVEKGFYYDFDSVINSDINLEMLKFFIELGNNLTDDHIMILLSKKYSNDYCKKITFLLDNNYITEKHFTNKIVSDIIWFDLNLLDYLINKLNIIELINLDILMKTSILRENINMIKKCIEYGINVDDYMKFAVDYSICITKKLIELGGNIPDDICIYNPYHSLSIDSIDIILENNYDSLENLLLKIINQNKETLYIDEILHIMGKLISTNKPIPDLNKILIKSYYYSDNIYKEIIKLDLNLDNYQQIIVNIMRKEYDNIEQLIFSSTYYNSIELLFVVVLSENIDLFKLLLEINCNDTDYLSWAFVFSGRCFKLMKYIVDNYNVDIYQRQIEVCIMIPEKDCQIKRYLQLMGYKISCIYNTECNNEKLPLVEFMKELSIDSTIRPWG